jgi:DNA-binding NtrC family response regulator
LRARIIFATHRDLEQMVAEVSFRQDLFYRVNVMNIGSPALRQHAEDIPLLVQHFIGHYSELYGKAIEGIEPEALALLERYGWPGNVRELENAVQRAIIMAEERRITRADLPQVVQEQDLPDYEDDLPAGSFEYLMRNYKFKLAVDAVQQCNGNKTLAAQSLSITRAYLHRLLRQPGASPNVVIAEIPSRTLGLPVAAGE